LNNIALYTLIGTASGVLGTAGGGMAAYIFKTKNRSILGVVLDFAAGLMLSVVCFDLLPHAIEIASFPAVLTGVAGGILFVMLVQTLLERSGKHLDGMALTAVTVALGIAVHNVPEGLAIGAELMDNQRMGLALALTMFLHDIPEGLGVGMPMRINGAKLGRAAFLSLLAGLPTGAGALVGALAGGISNAVTAACLSSAGGAMLYLVLSEMMPQAHRMTTTRYMKFSGIAGVLAGLVISRTLG
jgi:ZIP family zinc transporter